MENLIEEKSKLKKQNIFDQQKLNGYIDAIEKCDEPDINELESVYEELNFFFPDKVKEHIEKSVKFHKQIIKDREEFLNPTIKKIRNNIEERIKKINEIDKKINDK